MAERMERALIPPGAATEAPLEPLFSAITGRITSVRNTFPDTPRIEIRDQHKNTWHLSVLDSSLSSSGTEFLEGETVVETSLSERTGELVFNLSNGSALTVSPNPIESRDDPPNWEVVTPNGWSIEFGPGPKVQIQRADVPVTG